MGSVVHFASKESAARVCHTLMESVFRSPVRSRPLLERIRAQEEKDEALASLQQFRTPRDALLLLVSEYIRLCGPRVRELRRILPPRLSAPELLDGVCITVGSISSIECGFISNRRKTIHK